MNSAGGCGEGFLNGAVRRSSIFIPNLAHVLLGLNLLWLNSRIYHLLQAKSRKYRGMFEVNSPGKKYKFGKRIGLNK